MKKIVLASLTFVFALAASAEDITINPGPGVDYDDREIRTGGVNIFIKSGKVRLNSKNDYTGTTQIDGGTLELTGAAPAGEPSEIGANGPVDLADGVLRYTGPAGAIFGHPITNSLPSTDNPTSVAALDIQNDLVLTNWFNTKFIPTVKYGKGSLILRGKKTTKEPNWFQFLQGASGLKGVNAASQQFVVPTDGTSPRTGFENFALLAGKIILDEGTVQVSVTGNRAFFGGWTAGEGEEEADIELVVNDGCAWTTANNHYFGQLHGFKNYNTPHGPAKAWLTITGGTYTAAGGQASRWGSMDAAPTVTLKDGTKKQLELNSDLRITVNKGGTWTHGTSRAGFFVLQRPGQKMTLTVDGGTYHAYLSSYGVNAVSGDVTGTVDIDVKNGGLFEVGELFFNGNAGTPHPGSTGRTNTPPITISVTAGGVFSAQWVTNFTASVVDYVVDGGTLQNYNYNIYYNPSSGTPENICPHAEKVVVPPNATSLTLGRGGVTVKSAGTCWDGDPNIVIIGKGFVASEDLPEGVQDGGVTIECGTIENRVRIMELPRYHGPTKVTSGVLELVGANNKLPDSSETTISGGELTLAGADQAFRRLVLGAGADGHGAGLRLGPNNSVTKVADLAIEGAPTIWLGFTDVNGTSLTTTQSDRKVMTFPASAADALMECSFGASFDSQLALSKVSLTDNLDGTMTLKATMAAAGSAGIPTFVNGFAGALTLKGESTYRLEATDANVLQYKAGKYLVARYKKDGDTSILDRFVYPGYFGKDVYFTETYIGSGTHEGFTEIYLNIVDLPMQDATWTGAAASDNLMSTLGNWQGPPSSIDLEKGSLKINVPDAANNEMVFEDGTRIGSFISSRVKTASPFWVRGATPESEMIIDGRFSVADLTTSGSACVGNNGQIVLQGHFRAMDGVDTTTPINATTANASQFAFCIGYFENKADAPADLIGGETQGKGGLSVPLVLSGAHIHHKMVVRTNSTGQKGIHVMPNTDNSIDGFLFLQTAWSWLTVEQGARLTIYGGGRNDWTWKKDGLGELIITEKPWVTRYMWELNRGKMVFAVPGNQFICSNNGGTLGLPVTGESELELAANGAFENGLTTLQMTGTGREILEVHDTTNSFQRVRFINTNKGSYLHGDYPAMIIVNGGYPDPAYYKEDEGQVFDMEVAMQITGGLGFRKTGSDETLLFRGQDFESCGDLEVDSGVIEFAEDASWRNGKVLRAWNTGKFRFNSPKQLGHDVTLYFADSGQLDFVGDAGGDNFVRTSAVYVKNDETGAWEKIDNGVYSPTDGSVISKYISGNIQLQVGKKGSIIRFW